MKNSDGNWNREDGSRLLGLDLVLIRSFNSGVIAWTLRRSFGGSPCSIGMRERKKDRGGLHQG